MNLRNLSPLLQKGIVRVVIETPKGSRNKFDYDPRQKIFTLAKVLPEGMVFPYDFGFVPQTTGEDGDPLDALVLLAEPVHPGCVVDCRLLGVIQATQQKKSRRPIRNDRFLCASRVAPEFEHLKKPGDLSQQILEELEAFFVNYNRLEGKVFKILAIKNSKPAFRLIEAARDKK